MVKIRTHANPLQVPEPAPLPGPPEWWQHGPVVLEVGFGRGDVLLGLARAHPEATVLGLEIRRALIEHVEARARRLALGNLVARLADATRHLDLLLPRESVTATLVLFPDPWRKRRHRKRLVLTPRFLEVLHGRLRPGGTLDVQTDHEWIAAEVDALARGAWVNVLGPGELRGEILPDCRSRRCRMHRERGAPIYKLRLGRADAPPPVPEPGVPDPWLGCAPVEANQDRPQQGQPGQDRTT
jgi:tRNA G46 methylase TrmB